MAAMVPKMNMISVKLINGRLKMTILSKTGCLLNSSTMLKTGPSAAALVDTLPRCNDDDDNDDDDDDDDDDDASICKGFGGRFSKDNTRLLADFSMTIF